MQGNHTQQGINHTGLSSLGAISSTHAAFYNELFTAEERAILGEVDELTLDFSSLSKDSVKKIEPSLVVVGYGELCEEFLNLCVEQEHGVSLEITHLLPQDFVSLKGQIGAFELLYKLQTSESGVLDSEVHSKDGIARLSCAQVVSFAALDLPKRKGIHFANEYLSAQDMLGALLSLCGEQSMSRNIILSPTHCQYQSRRAKESGEGFCHLCTDVCPTLGISKDDTSMLLSLSPMDCIACGKCVSVCPTGSVQREGDTLEAFAYKARLYKGRIPLVISREAFHSAGFAKAWKHLREANALLLPFVLEVPDMLNETYLLTLLQESASSVLFYETPWEHTQAAISSLNEASMRIFGAKTIYDFPAMRLATMQQSLSSESSPDSEKLDSELLESNFTPTLLETIKAFSALPQLHYAYTPTTHENAKEIFSERMRFWVKGGSFGVLPLKGFGQLQINAQKCTLCLSCVEACNTKALLNNTSSFELLFKPSLCTNCGYCVSSCAENVLGLVPDSLALEAQSFEYTTIAADESFKCVECEKIFATKKSIEKIKAILTPAFGNDALKLKTLECCADCKVKVMFEGAN